MIRFLVVLFTCLSPVALGEEVKEPSVRKRVWSLGVNAARHTLKGGDGNQLVGSSGMIQIGHGSIHRNWYVHGSIDIITGPFETTRRKDLTMDFTGTGLTGFWGYNAEPADIRSDLGGYGFALGFHYADMVGRSFGERVIDEDLGTIVDQRTMRVTQFAVLPALFFCWLEDPRPTGNDPKLLATRIEGYFLTIGMAMPIHTAYRVRFNQTEFNPNQEDETRLIKNKGRLKGYTIMVALSSMLGV